MTTLPPPLRGTSLKEGGKGAAVTPANPSRIGTGRFVNRPYDEDR